MVVRSKHLLLRQRKTLVYNAICAMHVGICRTMIVYSHENKKKHAGHRCCLLNELISALGAEIN